MEKQLKINKLDILKIIPHREPMVFVDGVVEMTEQTIITYKEVTSDEYYFKGHFPNNEVFPGVFIIESVAQSSIVLLSQDDNMLSINYTPLLYHTDFKFKQIVRPESKIYMYIKLLRKIKHSAIIEAEVKVKNQIVAKGKLSFVFKINEEEIN